MAEPTLQDVFGANASQTATQLVISKADLATVGLTPSDVDTPESLYVAMLLLAAKYLTETNQQVNPDIQITITPSLDSLVSRNNQLYRQRTYTIELQKPDNNVDIDPDDY